LRADDAKPALIEQFGADAVPTAQRTKTWVDVMVIYSGLNISIGALLFGGVLVPDMGWTDALLAIVIGNVAAAVLMTLTGHMGVDHGLPASVVNRQSLGHPLGSSLNSVITLVCVTGWFGVQNEVAGLALSKALETATGFSAPVLMIFLLGATNVLVSVLGIESIKWLSRLSVPLLVGVLVWAGWKLVQQQDFTQLLAYAPTGEITMLQGIDWMIGGWIVGIHIAADVARHVKSRGHNWAGTLLGLAPLAMFTCVLGAMLSIATGDWNPVEAIAVLGLGVPAMLIITLSTWTTNDLNLYNAGLALTNVFPRLGRWTNTIIVGSVGTILSMLRITENFTSFLDLLVYLFVPLVGVTLADYYVVRNANLESRLDDPMRDHRIHSHGINGLAWTCVAATAAVAISLPNTLPVSLIALVLSGGLYVAGRKVLGFACEEVGSEEGP